MQCQHLQIHWLSVGCIKSFGIYIYSPSKKGRKKDNYTLIFILLVLKRKKKSCYLSESLKQSHPNAYLQRMILENYMEIISPLAEALFCIIT